MTITLSSRFLYILGDSGLLCVIPGVARGCHGIPRFKGQLTLSQPGEADYAYQITMAYLARVIWIL